MRGSLTKHAVLCTAYGSTWTAELAHLFMAHLDWLEAVLSRVECRLKMDCLVSC